MFNKYLSLFLVSMIPLLELRGSMVLASGWQMPMLQSLAICAIGNMIPVPFIYFFANKILNWGKDKPLIGKFFSFCLDKGHKGGIKLQKSAGNGIFIALLLFVGIPIPGTGAWTGTLAASILDIGFKKSVVAVLIGVILAGIIMGVLSSLGFAFLFGMA